MPTTYDALIQRRADDLRFSYQERDTMLYALSVGLGADPMNERELPFVFEGAGLKVVPTQACVVARSSLLADAGLDRTRIVHGQQAIVMHGPLPPAAELIARSWIADIIDKGIGRGALVQVETEISLADRPEMPVCTLSNTTFARGDGGIGGPGVSAAPPVPVPSRAPDRVVRLQTSANQALLYRLNGDRNPLHADPGYAAKGGFDRPILHGLCTYGIACRALLTTVCDHDPNSLRSFAARFTAPVYPGECLTTEIWQDRDVIAFRCRAEGRGVIVLDFGAARLAS